MTAPKPEPVSDPPDTGLAEAVERALDTIRSYCTIDRSTLRALLDSWRQRGDSLQLAAEYYTHAFPERPWDAGPPDQRIAMLLTRQTREVERLKAELAKLKEHQDAAIALLEQRDREQKTELAAANKRITFLSDCVRSHHGPEPHKHE